MKKRDRKKEQKTKSLVSHKFPVKLLLVELSEWARIRGKEKKQYNDGKIGTLDETTGYSAKTFEIA